MGRKVTPYWTGSLLAVAMFATAGAAQAEGRNGSRAEGLDAPVMAIGGAALPPAGFLALCARSPRDCVEGADSLPDIAALEAAANRNFWTDVFRTRSAPAALPRSDFFDWATVFAQAAAGRAVKTPVIVADGLVSASPATSRTVERLRLIADAPLAFDTPGVAVEAPAANDVDPAWGDRTEVPVVAAGDPVEASPVVAADSETGTAPAADAGTPAVEAAAKGGGDFTASATDSPITGPVNEAAPGQAAVFALDRAGWRLVDGVNRRLNRDIRQTSDDRLYGMEDFWNRPRGRRARGDCEDYVLAKRAALIAEGVPAAVLSIAIVETRWGESHAVLLLASDRGEFILDSLSPWLLRWDRAGYVWRERQLPGRPFDWVRVAV